MPWFKVDDLFWGHKKVADLESGPCFAEALALWTLAGSWCAQHLTDGRVPVAQLRKLVPFKTDRAAAELVRVGLWITAEGGFEFRDWSGYQPSKEKVLETRAKTAAKVAGHRSRNQSCNPVTDKVTARDVTEPVTGLVTPPPSRPDPIPSASHSLGAREPDQTEDRPRHPSATARFDAHIRGPAASAPDKLSCADVAEMFSALRVEAKRGSWRSAGFSDDERLDSLAKWANAEGNDRAAREAALTGAIRAFVADTSERVVQARWALAYFRDPGAYLAAYTANPARSRPASGALAKAQRDFEQAEAECREARERKDALHGREGFSEATKDHAKARERLASASDALDRARGGHAA